MEPPNSADGSPPDGLTRRNVLKMGAGATGAVLGLGVLPGSVAAWKRFQVDFYGCEEARMLVHEDDLQLDPPAVAKVVVDDERATLACRTVEFTEGAAERKPEVYGDVPVVTYTASQHETILGVIEYNYRDDRFSEPACLVTNDSPCYPEDRLPDPRDAQCVQAGKNGYWDGEIRECPWDRFEPDRSDSPSDGTQQPELLARLSPESLSPSFAFGSAVALDEAGELLLVGAKFALETAETSGAVYVYRRDGDRWNQTNVLAPDELVREAWFGASIDVTPDGETAVVGAPSARSTSPTNGVAYLLEYDGTSWTYTALPRPEFDPLDNVRGFGGRVAIDDDGDTVMVGAPRSSQVGIASGAAAVFERDGDEWASTELEILSGGEDNEMGSDVAIDAAGETVFAGTPVDNDGYEVEISSGHIDVYPRNGGEWGPGEAIGGDFGDVSAELGRALATTSKGEMFAAGDPFHNWDLGRRPGRAVVYRQSDGEWIEGTTLVPPERTHGDAFGAEIAVDGAGNQVLVGAPGIDHYDLGRDQAPDGYRDSVHLFTGDNGAWLHTATLQVADHETNRSFGTSLSVDDAGQTAAVGAPGISVRSGGRVPGAVYVYDMDPDE